MANELIPPGSPLRDVTRGGDSAGEDPKGERADAPVPLAEAARNEAEQFRRRAEAVRGVRDKVREASEKFRQGQ